MSSLNKDPEEIAEQKAEPAESIEKPKKNVFTIVHFMQNPGFEVVVKVCAHPAEVALRLREVLKPLSSSASLTLHTFTSFFVGRGTF